MNVGGAAQPASAPGGAEQPTFSALPDDDAASPAAMWQRDGLQGHWDGGTWPPGHHAVQGPAGPRGVESIKIDMRSWKVESAVRATTRNLGFIGL